VIVFSGSGQNIEEPNTVVAQMPAWTTDQNENPIPTDNFVNYPGYIGDLTGKPIQAENARGIAVGVPAILIGYSAGTESVLMYARWRINNGQPVRAAVLLGPTFVARREENTPPPVDFGIPDGEFNDWADYIDYLLVKNVDVLVIDDAAAGGDEAYGFQKTPGATGDFSYDTAWINTPHYTQLDPESTNNNVEMKRYVYNWIYSH
jgi:pimeloyl-ACP methyl ester carboxylesterase